jgi:hypothetical protein
MLCEVVQVRTFCYPLSFNVTYATTRIECILFSSTLLYVLRSLIVLFERLVAQAVSYWPYYALLAAEA